MAQAKILQLVCEVLNFKLTFYEVTKLNQNVLNKYRLEKGPMQNMQIRFHTYRPKSNPVPSFLCEATLLITAPLSCWTIRRK